MSPQSSTLARAPPRQPQLCSPPLLLAPSQLMARLPHPAWQVGLSLFTGLPLSQAASASAPPHLPFIPPASHLCPSVVNAGHLSALQMGGDRVQTLPGEWGAPSRGRRGHALSAGGFSRVGLPVCRGRGGCEGWPCVMEGLGPPHSRPCPLVTGHTSGDRLHGYT